MSPSLDRVFRVSLILKAIDGGLEIIGGLLLLIVSPSTLNSFARTVTQHELSQDPHDFIARHLLHATQGLSRGTSVYAGIYLLSHGIAKVAVIIAVLRGPRDRVVDVPVERFFGAPQSSQRALLRAHLPSSALN